MLMWSLREIKILIGMKSLLLEEVEVLNISKMLRLIIEYICINFNRIMVVELYRFYLVNGFV